MSISVSIFYYIAALAAGKAAVTAAAGGMHWLVYPLFQSLTFTASLYIIITGVRLLLSEIVPAFLGISEKFIPNAKPALDCPVVFPYAPTATVLGFISSFVGGLVVMGFLAILGQTVIIPVAIPYFFIGATAAVFGNASGGWKGAIAGSFITGILIGIGPALIYPIMESVGLSGTSFSRVVMSKGHAVAAQYAMLYQKGKIDRSEFSTFRQINSRLQGHPSIKSLPEVDATTGLLGQGLSIALGMAAAKKRRNDPHRVFAIVGDGEMHEGQIWETLQQAGHMKMDNLVAIIDYNGFSSHDPVNEVVNLEPLADKIRSFGWHVLELHNGNDMHQVADTLMLSRHLKGKPVAIVAHTTKGSGVSYMENNGDWHSKTPSKEQFQQAMEELQ